LLLTSLAAATSTPIAAATPTPIAAAAAAAAAAGGLLGAPGSGGLGSIRINTSRGSVAVAGGLMGEGGGVNGMYRGTVVRGPGDVKGDQVVIQDCTECHIYMLAPLR
jgi:hypothetical protein